MDFGKNIFNILKIAFLRYVVSYGLYNNLQYPLSLYFKNSKKKRKRKKPAKCNYNEYYSSLYFDCIIHINANILIFCLNILI